MEYAHLYQPTLALSMLDHADLTPFDDAFSPVVNALDSRGMWESVTMAKFAPQRVRYDFEGEDRFTSVVPNEDISGGVRFPFNSIKIRNPRHTNLYSEVSQYERDFLVSRHFLNGWGVLPEEAFDRLPQMRAAFRELGLSPQVAFLHSATERLEIFFANGIAPPNFLDLIKMVSEGWGYELNIACHILMRCKWSIQAVANFNGAFPRFFRHPVLVTFENWYSSVEIKREVERPLVIKIWIPRGKRVTKRPDEDLVREKWDQWEDEWVDQLGREKEKKERWLEEIDYDV